MCDSVLFLFLLG